MLNAIGLANPGTGRVPRARRCRNLRARSTCRSGCRSAASRARVRETCEQLASRRRGVHRAEPQLPERRRGAGVGRGDRRGLPRGDRKAALRQGFSTFLGHRRDRARDRGGGRRRAQLVNTLRGVALDARLRPTLSRGAGGYSGPALKPVALAAVLAARRATQLPIVGMGGVRDRTRRARVHCVRCDTRRARDGAVRGPGCADTRARRARRGGSDARLRHARRCVRRRARHCCQIGKLAVNVARCTALRGW